VITEPIIANGVAHPAETHYEVLQTCGLHAALVRFTALTGRKHQIRIHAATGLNCAILGDDIHGSKPYSPYVWSAFARLGPVTPKLHLHAHQLSFSAQAGKINTPSTITAPLPEHFRLAMKALGLDSAPFEAAFATKQRWFRKSDTFTPSKRVKLRTRRTSPRRDPST
jgi:23S rRNA pseudouridine955/2504/2580 synthase